MSTINWAAEIARMGDELTAWTLFKTALEAGVNVESLRTLAQGLPRWSETAIEVRDALVEQPLRDTTRARIAEITETEMARLTDAIDNARAWLRSQAND